MGWHGLSIHGNAVFPQAPGLPSLLDVNGIANTSIVGYRQGWGNTFRGAPFQGNIFHMQVPTINLDDHAATHLTEVRLGFATTGTAKVTMLHIWGGSSLLATKPNLNLSGDCTKPILDGNDFLFVPALPLSGALGLSIFVDFGPMVSDVLFVEAYALFTT